MTKIFFQIMLNEVPKNCEKMIIADVKAKVKQQEIKEITGGFILSIFTKSTLKT